MDDAPAVIERARAGDRDALESLIRHFHPELIRRIEARIPQMFQDVISAYDVSQEVYIRLFTSFEQFEGDAMTSVGAWLWITTRRVLGQMIRAQRFIKRSGGRARSQLNDDSLISIFDQANRDSWTPSRSAIRAEDREALDRCLAALPPDYRAVIQAYDFENRSLDDLSRQFNKSKGAILMTRLRAWVLLRNIAQRDLT